MQPDVALLQGVDTYLMPLDWTGTGPLPCGASLDGYAPFRSYNAHHNYDEAGTVVLLRLATVQSMGVGCLPTCNTYGGKTGVVVTARLRSTEQMFSVASVQLPLGKPREQVELLTAALAARAKMPSSREPDAKQTGSRSTRAAPTHLKKGTIDHTYTPGTPRCLSPPPCAPWTHEWLEAALAANSKLSRANKAEIRQKDSRSTGGASFVSPPRQRNLVCPHVPMIIGGDFNTRLEHLTESGIDAPLLGAGLSRVPVDAPTHTKHGTIDHIYTSGTRMHGEPCVGCLPPPPCGPWTEGHDGSDHAWVSVRLSLA